MPTLQTGSNELKTQKKEQALDVIRSDSLSRSRSSLIDLAYANYTTWHSFVTLTFAENLTDVRDANKRFNTWVTQVRRKKSDFKYIAVPEFQNVVRFIIICFQTWFADQTSPPRKKRLLGTLTKISISSLNITIFHFGKMASRLRSIWSLLITASMLQHTCASTCIKTLIIGSILIKNYA